MWVNEKYDTKHSVFLAESSVHMAIEYFKASFKKDIELNDNLSDDIKEKQKQLFDISFTLAEENLKSQLEVQGRLISNFWKFMVN